MNSYEKLLFWLFKKNNKMSGRLNSGSRPSLEIEDDDKVNSKWHMVNLYKQ